MDWLEVLGWEEEQLDDLRSTAYSYIQQGAYDIALTFFDALALLAPATPYDLQILGALQLQIGNNLEALDHLERALKLDPFHLPTQLNRAKALFMLGYKRQGLTQAEELQFNENKEIASQAAALILAYK